MIHDKTLIESRFARTLHHYNTMAVVQRRIANRLSELIEHPGPQKIIEIGAGSGFLTSSLIKKYPTAHYIANDITAKSREFLPPHIEFIAGDGEIMPLADQSDIIASSSTVQWFDNLHEFIRRTYAALSDRGILAISTFGEQNFIEISSQLQYYTKTEIEQITTQSGLKIIHSEEWHEQMQFSNPLDVLRHIKATGVNAIQKTRWTSHQLQQFIANYPTPTTLTFHPIIIICTKIRN